MATVIVKLDNGGGLFVCQKNKLIQLKVSSSALPVIPACDPASPGALQVFSFGLSITKQEKKKLTELTLANIRLLFEAAAPWHISPPEVYRI